MSVKATAASLQVVRRDAAAPETWDEAARGARQRHFMFERAYVDYHADRFIDASLLVLHKGRAIAALPASRHGEEIVSHGGLTFGGMLCHPSVGAARAVEALGAALEAWRTDGIRVVTVKPVPHIYHVAPAEEELFALHAHGAQLDARHVSQAIWAGANVEWSQERLRSMRRGKDVNLQIGRSDAIEEFVALQRDMLLRRHNVEPVHTPEEMRLLARRFPDEIKLFTAVHEREIVAGVLVYETPTVAHAQYIAASERGHELRAQDALFAHLLAHVFAEKPWFDFGISTERDGTLNAGLARNKEGFGARAVVYDRYRLTLSGSNS